jgi:hypothetical protein
MKKTKLSLLFSLLVFGFLASIQSCKPDDDDHDHDHDAITKVELMFVDTLSNIAYGTYTWEDADGIGGNPPSVIDTIKLAAAKTYKVNVMVYAKHDDHSDNITSEILEENGDHLFVFKNSTANVTVAITDKDANNLPVGLESLWTTGAASFGSINVVLRHQPGVKDGTETPGDTDIDVVYPVRIQ